MYVLQMAFINPPSGETLLPTLYEFFEIRVGDLMFLIGCPILGLLVIIDGNLLQEYLPSVLALWVGYAIVSVAVGDAARWDTVIGREC